jgi:hypothetical protein
MKNDMNKVREIQTRDAAFLAALSAYLKNSTPENRAALSKAARQ